LRQAASPFCSGYLRDRVSVFALSWTVLNCDHCVTGLTAVYHYAQPLAKMGSPEVFTRAGLQPWSYLTCHSRWGYTLKPPRWHNIFNLKVLNYLSHNVLDCESSI
jgi:hypothetical protein